VSQNDIESEVIDYFPTVKIYPISDKKHSVEYTGEDNAEEMVKFIKNIAKLTNKKRKEEHKPEEVEQNSATTEEIPKDSEEKKEEKNEEVVKSEL